MLSLKHKLAACTAVAALGAVSLFAAQTAPGARGHGRMGAFLSSYLNLTPSQQTQAKSIFQNARQSGQPVRQQLKQTRQSLQAAIQANNTAEIQVYQILTPDQQQKWAQLRQARNAARHSSGAAPQNN